LQTFEISQVARLVREKTAPPPPHNLSTKAALVQTRSSPRISQSLPHPAHPLAFVVHPDALDLAHQFGSTFAAHPFRRMHARLHRKKPAGGWQLPNHHSLHCRLHCKRSTTTLPPHAPHCTLSIVHLFATGVALPVSSFPNMSRVGSRSQAAALTPTPASAALLRPGC